MSTRCNVIIKDEYGQVIFYRHSDGYPEGVKPTLTKFLDMVKSGKIRNNVNQASGWLILIGAAEYNISKSDYITPLNTGLNDFVNNLADWKVGAYEPSTCIHGDIEYLYEIDLDKQTLEGWKHNGDSKGSPVTI